MSGNIILIGMPGSGKSTVGVLLAKAAGMRFSDTDLLIQQETGKKLQEIIDGGGLEFFLKTEENVIAAADFENSVVATGGSAAAAIDFLKEHGAKRIKLMCIIAAPEGVEAVTKAHPDVEVFCGVIDEKLNENCYIVPGLGDAGDRLFGTL